MSRLSPVGYGHAAVSLPPHLFQKPFSNLRLDNIHAISIAAPCTEAPDNSLRHAFPPSNLTPKRPKIRPRSCSLGAKRCFLTAVAIPFHEPFSHLLGPCMTVSIPLPYLPPDRAVFSGALPHRLGSADIWHV